MGHERVGLLPKTRRWRDIVGDLASIGEAGVDVAGIVKQTTDSIRERLSDMERDESLLAAFKFLVVLSTAARAASPQTALEDLGVELSSDPSPLNLARALQRWMPKEIPSLEYGMIAQGAAADVIAAWSSRTERPEENLFGIAGQPFDVWKQAANGAGFCELSRMFFGKFTERYLNYFLEREASAVLPSLQRREQFAEELSRHVDDVSRHAFETAKITQSFAAGWFNKHAHQGVPSKEAIRSFLKIALGKLREELRREGHQ